MQGDMGSIPGLQNKIPQAVKYGQKKKKKKEDLRSFGLYFNFHLRMLNGVFFNLREEDLFFIFIVNFLFYWKKFWGCYLYSFYLMETIIFFPVK